MSLLYSHQRECANKGYKILKDYGIVYLAMQVRTGKTLTALSIAWMTSPKGVLFVTRNGAIRSIENDAILMRDYLHKHNMPVGNYEVLIINYENLHNIPSDFKPSVVIIDEAHRIGSYPKPSKWAKQLKDLCKGRFVIILSGTPSPESYSQLFHQFWVSDGRSPWKRFGNFYQWAKDGYVNIVRKHYGGLQFNDYSDANKVKVYNDIKNLLVTKTQKEAGITQNVEENIVLVPVPEEINVLMITLKKDRVVEHDGHMIVGDTGAKLMSKMHQLSGGTVIDENSNFVILSTFKADFIKDKFAGQHIAIFYKFQAEGLVLKQVFPKWTDDPEVFHKDRGVTFIRQVVSGREGISLRSADALIMYAIDFSAVSYFQSIARIQDIRRDKPALLFWVFSESSMDFENKVYKVVSSKKDYTLDYFRKDFGI